MADMVDSSPDRDLLLRLYDVAMDEYRFQVTLNQQRSQTLLTLSIAVTAAATALLRAGSGAAIYLLVGVIFVGGSAVAVISAIGVSAGHEYYRSIRDHKARLEENLGLGEFSIRTTQGMGGAHRRFPRVTTLFISVFLAIAVVDIAGAAYSVAEATSKKDAATNPAPATRHHHHATRRHMHP